VNVASVPTLDELIAHPERMKGLPMPVLAGLQLQLSAMQAAIAAELLSAQIQPARVGPSPDRTRAAEGTDAEEWIKGKVATVRFALPRAWLQRHTVQLQRAGIARRLGHRTVVYEAHRLDGFLTKTARYQVPGLSEDQALRGEREGRRRP
jgi:hypothetical protein